MTDRIRDFLKELTELSIKHNLVIGGCGCCGSPWITEVNKNTIVCEDLIFDSDKQCYYAHNELGERV